jgi:hypothetical protein
MAKRFGQGGRSKRDTNSGDLAVREPSKIGLRCFNTAGIMVMPLRACTSHSIQASEMVSPEMPPEGLAVLMLEKRTTMQISAFGSE